MRRLLNTLFVLSENAYLSLDGENVVVSQDRQETARFALHTLEGILCFSYAGASPALMGGCAERGISLAFFTPRGRFLARIAGEARGNVLLRQQQYRAADDPFASCRYARGFLLGKVYNARWVLERATRDHPQRVQNSVFECLLDAAQYAVFKAQLAALIDPDADSLRFYQLGNSYKTRVEHIGRAPQWSQDDVLLV